MSDEKRLETNATPITDTKTNLPNKVPNLRWAAITFILSGIVAYYIFLGNNWGVPDTYLILCGHLVILVCSGIAIFYERAGKSFLGGPHRIYFLYGIFLLLGAVIVSVGLSFGNLLVPYIIPFNVAPFAFYALIVTTLVLSVEFGIIIVKNFRN